MPRGIEISAGVDGRDAAEGSHFIWRSVQGVHTGFYLSGRGEPKVNAGRTVDKRERDGAADAVKSDSDT